MIAYYLDGFSLVAEVIIAVFLLATVRHLLRPNRKTPNP